MQAVSCTKGCTFLSTDHYWTAKPCDHVRIMCRGKMRVLNRRSIERYVFVFGTLLNTYRHIPLHHFVRFTRVERYHTLLGTLENAAQYYNTTVVLYTQYQVDRAKREAQNWCVRVQWLLFTAKYTRTFGIIMRFLPRASFHSMLALAWYIMLWPTTVCVDRDRYGTRRCDQTNLCCFYMVIGQCRGCMPSHVF